MTLSSGFGVMFAVYCLVALRAFQQQNVIHSKYWWAMATSYGMAFAEIALIINVVNIGWAAGWWVGSGGALGVVTAMYVHKRFVQKRKK